jgi:VanZ family protein
MGAWVYFITNLCLLQQFSKISGGFLIVKQPFPWKRFFRIAFPLLLTVLWLCFIFGNSLQNGVESGNQSHRAQELLNEIFENAGMENPISEKLLRKLAHFGEFAILSLCYIWDLVAFGLLSLSLSLPSSALAIFSAIPVCFCIAGIDEFLQRFSAGRAPQFTDMLIDTSGAIFAALCFFSLFCIIRHQRKKRILSEERPLL